MATEYPTAVRIEAETDAADQEAVDRLRTPVLLGTYGALWLAFTLGGVYVALTMAELVGGFVGAALLTTLGLGFIAAGPVAARRAMAPVLSRLE